MSHHTRLRRAFSTLFVTGILAVAASSQATTYYVRTDGGSATQCTGLVDAAYPGSGTSQPCAWDHPFRALPPGDTPRISGGDTLMIGSGSYRMGYGAPGAETCDAGGAFGCVMAPIPSGPSPASPTRILGSGQAATEFWGAERPWFIVNLTDSSNVEIGSLEITDHSGCVEFHSGGLACERDTPPYGDWASYGLYAEDSANVHLHDLNIHGLAAGGVHVGRLTDWTVENVRIAGNGSVGWDGDLWDEFGDSNSGALTFRHWTVEWNGCGETYPGGQPTGCWAQSAGGYGDGFATGLSGGHWLIEDSIIRYNTSDGLDFLYVREPGSSITIRRSLLEGNAGSQVKNDRGPFLIENSIIVGNCGFFDGQSFTYDVDNCRAMGDALDLGLMAGDHIIVTNNTISGEGDCLVGASFYDVSANGSERVLLRNNIFQGQVDFLQPFENTCLVYQETFPVDPFDVDYSIINDVKDNLCPGAHDQCGVAPGVVNAGTDTFDAHLLADSPAIDAGTDTGAPSTDFDNLARDASPDIGAYEYRGASPSGLYPADLGADRHTGGGSTGNGNGVTDPGESLIVDTTWQNLTVGSVAATGVVSGFVGPAGASYSIADSTAGFGTVAAGFQANCFTATGNCYQLSVSNPASRPASHWDATFVETINGTTPKTWTLHIGDSFTDVPRAHWAYRFVETIYHNGITSGCGAALYCPDTPLSRAEMAVLLLMAEHGSGWTPPLSTGAVFTDVPIDHWAGDFIEELAAEGITSGCGAGLYCPNNPITRAEMAVFLLAAEHGQGWTPPLSTGLVFADVPIDHWAGDFIEQLAAEGITSGCGGGLYCPNGAVTRAEMAVFLTATFSLTLY